MARVRFRDFRGGLMPSGPPEHIPREALRRARGIWPVRTPSLRSRGGTVLQLTLPAAAHSFFRFAGRRYFGAGTGLYLDDGTLLSSYSGDQLRFVSMPASPGQPDRIYIAGGGRLEKIVSITPPTVQAWGILPPPDGLVTANVLAQQTVMIDTCDTTTGWTCTPTPPGPVTVSNTIFVEGSGSITSHDGLTPNSKATWTKTFAGPINLNEFSPGANDSPDEDWIGIAIRISFPKRVDTISILFAKDANLNNGFTYSVILDDDVSKAKLRGRKFRGLADHIAVSNNEMTFIAENVSLPLHIGINELLGDSKASPNDNVWAVLKIPKNAFTVVGNATDWTGIMAMQLAVTTNGFGAGTGAETDVFFDDIKLIGGVGMQGDYQYLFTYRNNTLGIRSNPNLTPVKVPNVQRQAIGVLIPNAFLSTDPQVDQIELWRTFGNGAVFFLDQAVPNNVLVLVNDTVADYFGLHSSAPAVLQTEVLPLDNLSPNAPGLNFVDVVGPHYGRLFWIDRMTNRVYYSAPGRPESVAGFLIAAPTDDPGQRLILWNDSVWLLTSRDLYQIIGTDEPFSAVRVPAERGTLWPRSVVGTDTGIFFRAVDAPRIFDGMTRTYKLGFDAFGQLFVGEAAENLLPLDADLTGLNTMGCWNGEEYLLTDGLQTWAWNTNQNQWVRDFGQGYTLLAFEKETGFTIVGLADGRIGVLDMAGVPTDFGQPIPFEVQPPSFFLRSSELALVQRCFVELNSNGQVITPTLIVDGFEIALPPIQTAVQGAVELPVTEIGTVFGVRLTGMLTTGLVEIVAIEWDGPDVSAEQES